MPHCHIQWNQISLPAWEERFDQIRRASLLQSYDYARVICAANHQKARLGLIFLDDKEAGLVQILEARLGRQLLHGLILDCGPLWFDGFGTPAHITAFFDTLNHEFPARFGRRRRIIPAAASFEHPSYKRLPHPAYQTIWLDLDQEEEILRKALKPKWRNKLKKAEQSGLSVDWDEEGKNLSWLLTKYQSDQAKKEYDGASVALIRQFAKIFVPKNHLLIGRAIVDNQAIAAILILCHGKSATYQIGWSSEDGRKAAAHNLLLWQTVCHLKNKGFLDLDLGGINNDKAQGVSSFKEGMGGQKITYAGHYF